MSGTRYLPDDFVGSVVVHDVPNENGDGTSSSVWLEAGDAIPDGVELGQHIKTTTTKPLKARQREAEQAYQDEVGDGDPGQRMGTGEPGTFDPGQHTVAEVTRYLQQHPEDAGRVFDLEEQGQRRAGILGKQG